LLRHPRAVSSLEDCASGRFQRILPDVPMSSSREDTSSRSESPGTRSESTRASSAPRATNAHPIERVLLCSGKIYYEIHEERERLGRDDVAILRIEQLYPLSDDSLLEVLAPYRDGTRAIWVQEEPSNMGAWRYLYCRFGTTLFGRMPFSCVARPAAASPATGSGSSHKLEQQELLNQAFSAS